MSKVPRISVIIPSYNRAEVLMQTVTALCRQDVASVDYEIIIVDDGSTDDTRHAIESFLNASGSAIKYLEQENMGAASARNLGAANASGELLFFLDADVQPQPDVLKLHLRFHEEHPDEYDASMGRVEMAPELSKRAQVRQNETRLHLNGKEVSRIEWFNFRGSNVSLKRRLFERTGGFDNRMGAAACEDTELGFRLQREGMWLYFIPEALGYHFHPMDVQAYLRKAEAYGASLAMWYVGDPEAREFLISRYGLPVREIPWLRAAKYAFHRLLFGGNVGSLWIVLAAGLRIASRSAFNVIYTELYKACYRKAFRENLLDRSRPAMISGLNRWASDYPLRKSTQISTV